jgi:uncharacterized protein YcnI
MAAPAFAHVTIDPPSVPQGSTSKLSFLVPDELAPATTTELQVFFPTGADAIPGVTVEAKPGWKFTITKQRLAKPITTADGTIDEVVSAVDWKATTQAAAIRPDEFGEFTINADGISAHATQLVFKVIQTYSNGTAVRWVDPVTAGGPAAEHPTPILELTAPGRSGASVTTTTGAPAASGTTIISTTKDNSARALAVVAMVLGAVALLAATGALIKKRRA